MAKSSSSRRISTSAPFDGGAQPGSNVTLGDSVRGYFPCPTCKRLRPLRPTIKGKPCLTCNDCMVQVFFRGKEGILRLQRMIGHGELSGHVQDLSGALEYCAYLRRRLREIDSEKPVFGKNPELEFEK